MSKRDTRIDAAFESADYFYVYNYFNLRGFKVEQTEVGGKIDYRITKGDKSFLVEAKFRSIDFNNEATKPWYFNLRRLHEMRKQKGDSRLLLFYAFPKNNKFVLYDLDKLHLDDEESHELASVSNPSKGNETLNNLLLRDSDIVGVRDFIMDGYNNVLRQAMAFQGMDNKEIYEAMAKWR